MSEWESLLSQQVQENCHIADASHAGNYTLCIYLLKMREFYRWEQGLGFADALEKEAVGSWLRQREDLWDQLEDKALSELTIGGEQYDAWQIEEINRQLRERNLIYSAGIGTMGRPHFFLGKLEQTEQAGDYTLYVVGEEYARDLPAPPAMSQGKDIFLRRESLRRVLWERIESWNWNRPKNAMERALSFYDLKNDLDASLDAITEKEMNSVLQHEIGEVHAGQLLGEAWEEMLAALPRSRVEFIARAIRDLLADHLTTLPYILEQEDEIALHFYMANHSGMRQVLAPGLKQKYEKWLETQDYQAIQDTLEQDKEYWLEQAQELLQLYQEQGAEGLVAAVDEFEKGRH
jgi:hypothetical protein